ncbi:MAG TPA: ATP-binding protein [Flavobacteriales bacterium]|nr:ATP-binding protein [Flavobacteriales bacterium]
MQGKNSMRANLTTICSKKAQVEIRAFLNRLLAELPIEETIVNQIVLAIDEAVANAIIHGNNEDPSQQIEIDIETDVNRIAIEIGNIGLFDPKQGKKEQKGMREIIKQRQKGGMGLKLIYSIMDIVCFFTRENRSYVLLVKMLDDEETKVVGEE